MTMFEELSLLLFGAAVLALLFWAGALAFRLGVLVTTALLDLEDDDR